MVPTAWGRSRDARWLPTWNVSGSWNMLEEEFMKHQDVVSTLSLRATYGLTATMGPADNALAVFRNSTTYRGDDGYKESQIYIESLQNKDLTWEKQYEFNFGFDFGVLRNRISLSTDIYSRRGFDHYRFDTYQRHGRPKMEICQLCRHEIVGRGIYAQHEEYSAQGFLVDFEPYVRL